MSELHLRSLRGRRPRFRTYHGLAPGGILIYPRATGTPTEYQDSGIYYYFSDGYDDKSNLFFDGCSDYSECSDTTASLGELPKNSNSPFTLPLTGGTIYYPGAVFLDGPNVMVGDQDCSGSFSPETSCLHRVMLSHSGAKITGTISLMNSAGGAACDVVQATRNGGQLYGGDFEYQPYTSYGYSCSTASEPSAFYQWGYPKGQKPQKVSAPLSSSSEPNGVAFSHH